MDDSGLLTRYARDGDAEAFAELTRRHAGLVYGTCLRVLGDQVRAEDAAQEAFLALARHAGAIRQSLVAWLHRVALHAALRQRRRERTALAVELGDIPAPVREAWRALLPQLDDALERLPAHLREVIARRYLQGQVQEAIATELGISQATVSRRLEDGVRRLRTALALGADEGTVSAALVFANVQPPPPLITTCGKIAIAGRGVLHGPAAAIGAPSGLGIGVASMAAVLVLGAIGIGLASVRGRAPSSEATPSPTAQSAGTPPPIAAIADPRDRMVTIHVTGMSDREVVATLNRQLRLDLGERIVLVNADDERAAYTIDAERVPLRQVLATMHSQYPWRVRVHRGLVVLDLDQHFPNALDWQELAKPAWTPAVISSHLCFQVALGDLDQDGKILAAFADPGATALAASDPQKWAMVQEAACEALARVGASWQTWRPDGGALCALADDARACDGLRAMWRLAREHHQHILPFQIYLTAALGCADLAPALREIVVHPASARPGLAPSGLVPDLALSAERASALAALGWLPPDPASATLVRGLLHAAPDDAARTQLIASMGALGAASDADLVMPRADDDAATVATCVVALARLDPARLRVLLATPGMPARARLASLVLPRAEFLTIALAGCEAPDFQSRWVAWRGTAQMDLAALRAAMSELDLRRNVRSPVRMAILARAGDDAALDALIDLVAHDPRALSGPSIDGADDVALELLAGLDVARQRRALARLRTGLDLAHAGDGVLSMLRVRTTDALVRELHLAWPQADAQSRAALARALARCNLLEARNALARIMDGPDARALVEALGPADLHGFHLRMILEQFATRHLGVASGASATDTQQDAGLGMAIASCGLLAYPDATAVTDLLLAHLREVTLPLFRHVTTSADAPPLWHNEMPTDLTWSLIAILDRPDELPFLRACDDYLEHTTTHDCGQMCLLLPDDGHTAAERGPACLVTIDLASWERTHVASDFDRTTRDLIDESAILSGSLDAAERTHSTIIFHPELARQAKAAQATAPAPQASRMTPAHDF